MRAEHFQKKYDCADYASLYYIEMLHTLHAHTNMSIKNISVVCCSDIIEIGHKFFGIPISTPRTCIHIWKNKAVINVSGFTRYKINLFSWSDLISGLQLICHLNIRYFRKPLGTGANVIGISSIPKLIPFGQSFAFFGINYINKMF